MITHLEPDILECDVKGALGSITTNKASGDNEIPAKLFQILKDDAVNCCTNSAVATGREKVSFHSIFKEINAKESSNYHTIALISHASKVMLKILQARLQQYVNQEIPDVQAGFKKGRGTRDLIANICWIIEKGREFQKKHLLLFSDDAKAFDCVDHKKLWKILKEMGIPDHLTCSLKNLMQVKKQQLEPDMEQQIGSK